MIIRNFAKTNKGLSIDGLVKNDFIKKSEYTLESNGAKGWLYIVLIKGVYYAGVDFKDADHVELEAKTISAIKESIKKNLKRMGFKDPTTDFSIEEKLELEDEFSNFWKSINQMNWAGDNNYERIKEELKKGLYGKKKEQKLLLNTYRGLYDNIDSMFWKQHNNPEDVKPTYSGFIGDDGISDYLADIIGQGEVNYNKYISPKGIKEKLLYKDMQDCRESFAYSFHDII